MWILIWQFAAMGLGHGGLFLATPLQTLGALAQLCLLYTSPITILSLLLRKLHKMEPIQLGKLS